MKCITDEEGKKTERKRLEEEKERLYADHFLRKKWGHIPVFAVARDDNFGETIHNYFCLYSTK